MTQRRSLFKLSLAASALAGAFLCASPVLAADFTPDPKKSITVAVPYGYTTLDPYDATDTLSRSVSQSFYESLFRFDANMKIVPSLGLSYEVSDDGRIYTVKLRPGVKFQDGTDFTAEAVKVNFDRVTNPENHLTRYQLYSVIERTEVVDPLTVRFVLKEPLSSFIPRISNGTASMICPKSLEKWGRDIAFHPCGTGPYIMKDYNPSERLYVVKNPNYWDPSRPKLDAINWRPVVENATRAAMVRTGEAQFVQTLPAEQINRLKDDNRIDVIVSPSVIARYLVINHSKKPFNDLRVRLAINYAINRDALVKVAFSGYAQPMDGVIPSPLQDFKKLGPWPYDPKKARELLKEAGFPNGFETELWSGYNNTTAGKVIQFIQQQLRQVGIKTSLRTLEAGQRVTLVEAVPSVEQSKTKLYYIGWSNSTGDADWAMRPIFDSRCFPPQLSNEGYYANPKVDEGLDRALAETDPKKREEIYGEVQTILWNDAAFVPLVTEANTSAKAKNLVNFSLSPSGDFNFYDAEIKE